MKTKLVRVAPFLSNRPLSNVPIAVQFIRKMRGSSQPALIRCSDHKLYVVKFHGNPQEPNVLANEVMGSELLQAAGLPTPIWSPVYLSKSFVAQFSEMSHILEGYQFPIEAGFHFGSSFLGQEQGETVFEILPGAFVSRIQNHKDFMRVLLFDVWLNHCDVRQAVFVCPSGSRALNAIFIDSSHMFGGPSWSSTSKTGQARCLDLRLYAPFQEREVESWILHLELTMWPLLDNLIKIVPRIWYSGNLETMVTSLQARLGILRSLASQELNLQRRFVQQTYAESLPVLSPVRKRCS